MCEVRNNKTNISEGGKEGTRRKRKAREFAFVILGLPSEIDKCSVGFRDTGVRV